MSKHQCQPFTIRPKVKSLLLLLVIAWPITAHCWEDDFHYGLTKWLAIQAGYRPVYAEQIAKANVGRDAGATDAIYLVVLYGGCLLKGDPNGAALVRDEHFPSFGDVPGRPEDREVKPNSPAATRAINLETKSETPRPPLHFALRSLGKALHQFQDSWSHQGVPDTAEKWCDTRYAWGHPKIRGGWNSHNADLTWVYPEDALDAAMETFKVFLRWREKYQEVALSKPNEWNKIKDEVNVFIKAKTKSEKRTWFKNHKQDDLSFLERINLPGVFELNIFSGSTPQHSKVEHKSFRAAAHKVQEASLLQTASPSRSVCGTADRILIGHYFDQFFSQWLLSDIELLTQTNMNDNVKSVTPDINNFIDNSYPPPAISKSELIRVSDENQIAKPTQRSDDQEQPKKDKLIGDDVGFEQLLDVKSIANSLNLKQAKDKNLAVKRFLALWRAADHGKVASFMHGLAAGNAVPERELAAEKAMPEQELDGMLENAVTNMGAHIVGARLIDIARPFCNGQAYLLVPHAVLTNGSYELAYTAVIRLRHTTDDTIAVTAMQGTNSQWRIVNIMSFVDHE